MGLLQSCLNPITDLDSLPPAIPSIPPGGLPNSHYIDVEHNLRTWDGTTDPASVVMHDNESSTAAAGSADNLPDISGITLNAEQQKGLDLVISATRPDATAGDQLLLLFHGSPGTGKTVLSRVMYVTISQMFEGQPIRCCASTGVAAAEQILGCTYHTLLQFGMSFKKLSRSDLLAIRLRYKGLKFLFVDEVSMVDGCNLYRISLRCQDITGVLLPFGGLHVVLFGDFFQLPPCRGSALYSDCLQNDAYFANNFECQFPAEV